jgi:hypothetical protein
VSLNKRLANLEIAGARFVLAPGLKNLIHNQLRDYEKNPKAPHLKSLPAIWGNVDLAIKMLGKL